MMKWFTVLVYIIAVVVTRHISDVNKLSQRTNVGYTLASEAFDANTDILWNYQLDEDNTKPTHKTRRQVASYESDDFKHATGINLPPDYNKYELPKPADSPMPVFVFINISKVLDWDEFDEYIRLDLRLKVMWTDFRILEFNKNVDIGKGVPIIDSLTPQEIQRMRKVTNNPDILLRSIWKPNLFIGRLLKVRHPVLMAKPLKIRYIPDYGWFEYITRVQIKIDCDMNLQYYPADTQHCTIPIRSYTYLKSSMNLSWYKMGVVLTNPEVSNFEARVDDVIHYFQGESDDPNEIHEVLEFSLYARRLLGYHLIQTYLASSFYIVITTLCFLLPSTMIEARIGMSMTTLLTLTAMFASVRESTLIVSYTKAIDIWMVGCIFFVFLTLVQFTFCSWIKHEKNSRTETQSKGIGKGVKNVIESKNDFEMDSKYERSEANEVNAIDVVFPSKTLKKYEKFSAFLEAYSFHLFFGIFVAFSAIYWICLLSVSAYYSWSINPTWNTF